MAYPWAQWFDGTEQVITRGIDFPVEISVMQSYIGREAKRRGGKATTRKAYNSIIFRFKKGE